MTAPLGGLTPDCGGAPSWPELRPPAPIANNSNSSASSSPESDVSKTMTDEALLKDSGKLAEHLVASYRELQNILVRVIIISTPSSLSLYLTLPIRGLSGFLFLLATIV